MLSSTHHLSTAFLLCLGLVLSTQALAPNLTWDKEPESFRGAKFLASESEVRSKFTMADCFNRENDEKTCFFFFNVVSAEIGGVATFQRNALVDVTGVVLQTDFTTVLDTFTERFGSASSRIADRFRWNGKAVSIELQQTIADDRKESLKAVVSSFCATQRAVVSKLDADSQSLAKQQDEDLQRSGADIHVRAQTAIRFLERQQTEHQKNTANAGAQCQEFSSRTYGLFSITVNDYSAQLEKRKLEEKKKGASAL